MKRVLKSKKIRSDHRRKFDNLRFNKFYLDNRYKHEFSCPRTPQQNSIIERKNQTLIEVARTI